MKAMSLLILTTSILAILPMFSSYAQHQQAHEAAQKQSLPPSSSHMNSTVVKKSPPTGSIDAHTHMKTIPQAMPGKATPPLVAAPSRGKAASQLNKQTNPSVPLNKSRISTNTKTPLTTTTATPEKKITHKAKTIVLSPPPQIMSRTVVENRHVNANEERLHRPRLQHPRRTETHIAEGNYAGRSYYGRNRYYGQNHHGTRHYYSGWNYGKAWENGFLEGALNTAFLGYLQQLEATPDYQTYTYSSLYGDNVYDPSYDVLVNREDNQQQQRELLIQQLEQDLSGLLAEQFYATRPMLNLSY
ncbi:MAG: hypothetical protein K2P93_01485 [Alphaproteobacteria bacterium]|nr:hypothetical protein [Alphaproteobacteria bacterium]